MKLEIFDNFDPPYQSWEKALEQKKIDKNDDGSFSFKTKNSPPIRLHIVETLSERGKNIVVKIRASTFLDVTYVDEQEVSLKKIRDSFRKLSFELYCS